MRRFFFLLFVALGLNVSGQDQVAKEVNDQAQFWWSINSSVHLSGRWGFMADFHIRRTNFVKDPNFYFLRGGASYWITNKLIASAGYAHMWLAVPGAPPSEWAYSNENRIFQQVQFTSPLGKLNVLNRFRNEQRWQQKMTNGEPVGTWRFTNRFRYLLSFTIPVFRSPRAPALVLADEILLHAGKEVVYNVFDQNRLFIGIRQKLKKDLSFDFGYMMVYQQKYSGYEFDRNHTVRWFFYYTPDLSGRKSGREPSLFDHGEE